MIAPGFLPYTQIEKPKKVQLLPLFFKYITQCKFVLLLNLKYRI